MLYFFTSQAAPAQNEFERLSAQREGCVSYASQQPKCKSTDFPLSTKLLAACKALNRYNQCATGSTDACLKECCSGWCPL